MNWSHAFADVEEESGRSGSPLENLNITNWHRKGKNTENRHWTSSDTPPPKKKIDKTQKF